MRTIKVLIIDDSLSMRLFLKKLLAQAGDIEVIDTAPDPIAALDLINKLKPDVLTLDVEMPNMDGLTFLAKLMRLHPMPVLMISTLTHHGTDQALKALELGAVDIVGKPSTKADDMAEIAESIIQKVRAVAAANVGTRRAPLPTITPAEEEKSALSPKRSTDSVLTLNPNPPHDRPPLIAIGASTGGTEAIKHVLASLPPTLPGIVITQHLGASFIPPFAKRLDTASMITVVEAKDGMPIEPGHAYVAPGDRHLAVKWRGGKYVCSVLHGTAVNRHKPSVDVLFRSMANEVGSSAVAVILTGMGDDGAKGLLEVKTGGGLTIAEDESTCIVYGMPRMAVKLGGVKSSLPLKNIPAKINELFKP